LNSRTYWYLVHLVCYKSQKNLWASFKAFEKQFNKIFNAVKTKYFFSDLSGRTLLYLHYLKLDVFVPQSNLKSRITFPIISDWFSSVAKTQDFKKSQNNNSNYIKF